MKQHTFVNTLSSGVVELPTEEEREKERKEWQLATISVVSSPKIPTNTDNGGKISVISEHKLIMFLFTSMFNNPERIDSMLGVWLSTCRGFRDPGACILFFMDLLHSVKVQIEFKNDGIVQIFDNSRFSLHDTFFTNSERLIMKAIIRDWRFYFRDKAEYTIPSMSNSRFGSSGPRSDKLIIYRSCIFDEELTVAIDIDRICARLFSMILVNRRGGNPRVMAPTFGKSVSILDQTLKIFKRKRRDKQHKTNLTSNVIRYGVLSIINQTWNHNVDYLPSDYYKLII